MAIDEPIMRFWFRSVNWPNERFSDAFVVGVLMRDLVVLRPRVKSSDETSVRMVAKTNRMVSKNFDIRNQNK